MMQYRRANPKGREVISRLRTLQQEIAAFEEWQRITGQDEQPKTEEENDND